jgi:hypothetical protein
MHSDSELFNASLPYLPVELGGPESPPPLPLEDCVHAQLRQQLSRRFNTIFAAYPLAEAKVLKATLVSFSV